MKLRIAEQRIEKAEEQTGTTSASELKKEIAGLRNQLQAARSAQGEKRDALREHSAEIYELHIAGRLGPSHYDLLPAGSVAILRDLREQFDAIRRIQGDLEAAEDRLRVLQAIEEVATRPRREAARLAQEARHCEAIREFNKAFDQLLLATERVMAVRNSVPHDARDWWPSWPQPQGDETLLYSPRIEAFAAAQKALHTSTYRPRRSA